MLSCVKINRLDDADMELTPAVAGIFPPVKKLGNPSQACFKVRLSLVGKILCDLYFVSYDFSVVFRTCFMGELQGKLQGAVWI